MNALPAGWTSAMGMRYLRATVDEVVAELEVGAVHRQALGIVHGGVYAGMIESVASVGASLHAMQSGRLAVGLENHTSFLHAVREGVLRATGRPLARGRRSHVWQVDVTDAAGRVAATGRVRLLCIEADAPLAGEPAGVKV